MPVKRVGWERRFYHGPAGSTASTQVTTAKDIDYEVNTEFGDTTDGGDGSTIPVEDSRPVKRSGKLSWGMVNKDSDAALDAFLDVATDPSPAPIALKFLDKAGGRGFDGDCYLTVKLGAKTADGQVYEFEARPTQDAGRVPDFDAT